MQPANPAPEATAQTFRRVKRGAILLSALMLGGIGGLMLLSAGKGEDITGIVAPALLIAILSGITSAVAAVMQKRAKGAGTPNR